MVNRKSISPKTPKNTNQFAKMAKEIDEKKRNEAEKPHKASYQNILWIDDMDDRNSGSGSKEKSSKADNNSQNEEKMLYDKIKWMENYLSQLPLINNITLVNTFEYAVETIIAQYSKFDLVIFDLDLNHGFYRKIPEDIKGIFKKHNIILGDNTFENKDDKKAAGMWLYFLLLSVGYPLNRMVIYSTYIKDDEDEKNDKFSFKEIPLMFEFDTLHKSRNNLDIEKYFSGPENSYYRVRRLVFQACDYWDKHFKNNESEIPFNKIYGLDIPLNSFQEMLTHVKMMFPVPPPYKEEEREKIYYEAARAVSVFHEEQAKMNKFSSIKKQKKFHQTVRYFRNWSAHNKIKEAAMSVDFFAVFFCIVLRTYFQYYHEKDGQKEDDYKKALDYEETYFSNQEHSEIEEKEFFHNFFDNTIKKDFDIDLNGVFKFEQNNNGNLISSPMNLDKFIFNSGQQNTTLPLKYVFFSILNSENYTFQLKCKNPQSHTSLHNGSWTLCLNDPLEDFSFESECNSKDKSVSNYEKDFLIRIYNCIKNADYKQ